MTISDSAINSPQTIALSGTGVVPPVTLSTDSLSFAATAVGLTSGSQSVTHDQYGTTAADVYQHCGDRCNATEFDFGNSCGSTLAVGANCSFMGTLRRRPRGNDCGGDDHGQRQRIHRKRSR